MNKILEVKNKITFFAILTIAVIALASCNKQAKLEKRLDGTWNITSYITTEYTDGVLSATFPSSTGKLILDAGSNTGSFTMPNNGSPQTLVISNWANTENKVTITLVDGVDQITMVWDVTTNTSSKQSWKYSETSVMGGKTYRYDTVMLLAK